MYKALVEKVLNYNENAKNIQMNAIGFSVESVFFHQTLSNKAPFNFRLKVYSDRFKKIRNEDEREITCVEFAGP